MNKAMTLTYEICGTLYLNVTNRCPCACTFCIRNNDDGAYGSESLWLEHEPTMDEMRAALAERDLSEYPEIVFCGYGEPTMRLDLVLELADYLRQACPQAKLRINTNGLTEIYSDEAHGTAAERIGRAFDGVSISLNAGNAELYTRVTRPRKNPEDAYESMLSFAHTCKEAGAKVLFTVVSVISPEEVAEAQAVADKMGIPLRVRTYIG